MELNWSTNLHADRLVTPPIYIACS